MQFCLLDLSFLVEKDCSFYFMITIVEIEWRSLFSIRGGIDAMEMYVLFHRFKLWGYD